MNTDISKQDLKKSRGMCPRFKTITDMCCSLCDVLLCYKDELNLFPKGSYFQVYGIACAIILDHTVRNEICKHMKNCISALHGVPFCAPSSSIKCIKNKNIIFIWMEITELLKTYNKLTGRERKLIKRGARVACNIFICINCLDQTLARDILL